MKDNELETSFIPVGFKIKYTIIIKKKILSDIWSEEILREEVIV